MKIVLIRHAKTKGNLEHRYVGKIDEPLCDAGVRELLKNQKRGIYPKCDCVYASPMKRCIHTAQIVYPDKQINTVSDLRECDFGIFEGKTYEELKNNPNYRLFIESNGESGIPGGENRVRFQARCVNGFMEALKDMKEKNISNAAIVCHGGTIMAILERFGGQGRAFYDYQTENCGGYYGTYDLKAQRFLHLNWILWKGKK